MHVRMCINMYVCVFTYKLARVDVCNGACMYTYVCICMCIHMYICVMVCIRSTNNTYALTNTLDAQIIHTYIHTYIYACIHTYTNIHTCIHTQTYTHVYIQTQTCMHTCRSCITNIHKYHTQYITHIQHKAELIQTTTIQT